jgi:hypothetical protein
MSCKYCWHPEETHYEFCPVTTGNEAAWQAGYVFFHNYRTERENNDFRGTREWQLGWAVAFMEIHGDELRAATDKKIEVIKDSNEQSKAN